jgi:hypothetical protein
VGKVILPLAQCLRSYRSNSTTLVERALELLESEIHILLTPEVAEGTCEWIFDHGNFRKWIDLPYSQLLWIHGVPGEQVHNVDVPTDSL